MVVLVVIEREGRRSGAGGGDGNRDEIRERRQRVNVRRHRVVGVVEIGDVVVVIVIGKHGMRMGRMSGGGARMMVVVASGVG